MNKKILLIIIVAIGIFMVGCSNKSTVNLSLDASTTANSLMPAMTNYNAHSSEELTRIMASGGDALATTAGQTEAVLVIEKTKKVVDCYHDVGAVASKGYTDPKIPLSAGIVAIADKKELINPTNLWTCVFGGSLVVPQTAYPTYELCTYKYTIVTPTNEFYVTFAGTTTEICHDMCKDLKGCSKY